MTDEPEMENQIEHLFGRNSVAAFLKRDAMRAREETAIRRLLGVEAR